VYTLVDPQFGYVRFTAKPYGINTEFSGAITYSVSFHLYTKGRHCYAMGATR